MNKIDNIISLSKEFISIPSTQNDTKRLVNVLEFGLSQVADYKHEIFEKNGIKSALIYNTNCRPNKFKIILNAHLDVVDALPNQFLPYEKNGRLFGRGSLDMKSAAAVEILLFKELANKIKYPLALQLVTDEEVGGLCGTKYQIEKGIRADFVIAGECTNFAINNKAKGVIWAEIMASGKTAHGAYLWKGENAIWKMNKFLNLLQIKFPTPTKEAWKTTVNVAKINTANQTINKVPDHCSVSLDFRYIPEESNEINNQIKKILPSDFKLNILLNEPAQSTDENNKFIKALKLSCKNITGTMSQVVSKHGASDIRHFNHVGCDGVAFGPIGEGIHTDCEWIDIKSLENYYLILKDFLKSITH